MSVPPPADPLPPKPRPDLPGSGEPSGSEDRSGSEAWASSEKDAAESAGSRESTAGIAPQATDAELEPAELAEAKHYGRLQRKCTVLDRFIDLAYWGFAGFVLARPLEEALASVGVLAGSETLRLLAMLLLLMGLHGLVSLPLSFYAGYLLEHRFGLSRLSVLRWAWRYIKELLLAGLLTALLMAGLFWIIRLTGPWWWVVGALAFFGVSVILGQLAPVVILPLFYRVERLDRPDLTDRLQRLAEGTGVSIEGVYRLDLSTETVKANAALAGLGRTRRVLLGDTLLEQFSPEEIEMIFAHELGHHVYRHIARMLGIGWIASAVGFWICDRLVVSGVAPLARLFESEALLYQRFPVWAVALLIFWLGVLGTLTGPLFHALSRWHERQADRYALDRTANPDVFRKAFRRLARLNKEDPDPPTWEVLLFHSHPPIRQRIGLAEKWKTRPLPENIPEVGTPETEEEK